MVRHAPFKGNGKLYEQYYCHQAGHGLPVFVEGRNYRRRGLGSLLVGIGRAIVPLLKSGGKALLKRRGQGRYVGGPRRAVWTKHQVCIETESAANW